MRNILFVTVLCCLFVPAVAEEIGTVSTTFKWLGPNDKIAVEVFEDQDVPGVACYLSQVKTGGIKGAIGVEDTSDASIACRQIGPIDPRGQDRRRGGVQKAGSPEIHRMGSEATLPFLPIFL